MKTQLKRFLFSFKGEPMMLVIVMLLVPLLFSFIQHPRIAALFAGALFLLVGVLTVRQGLYTKNKILIFFSFLFLGLFVLPIFILRILDWDANFQAMSFLGIPLSWLHEYSKWIYVLLLLSSFRARWIQSSSEENRN
ncbi:MAG TPA: hypothetical protein PLJ21_02295 [Pseudobdellovibrionaceae bacterium]|nr:hypothetical protein [Pseudobdellovibrionaceae bacterium]